MALVPFWIGVHSFVADVAGGLSLLACAGCGGERQGSVSGGEVASSGKLPVRDDEGGVVINQLADVFASLPLPVDAAFPADGAESGGITAAF